jgi:AGCS family alanine or glycine:cation symporter
MARMETLNKLTEQAASLVWGPWLIALLFGTHLFLTIRTGFMQRHLGHAIKLSVTKDEGSPGDISQFGALVTALAATIGTGNIYGVAGAVIVKHGSHTANQRYTAHRVAIGCTWR